MHGTYMSYTWPVNMYNQSILNWTPESLAAGDVHSVQVFYAKEVPKVVMVATCSEVSARLLKGVVGTCIQ